MYISIKGTPNHRVKWSNKLKFIYFIILQHEYLFRVLSDKIHSYILHKSFEFRDIYERDRQMIAQIKRLHLYEIFILNFSTTRINLESR